MNVCDKNEILIKRNISRKIYYTKEKWREFIEMNCHCDIILRLIGFDT
jgi:hypothetical protein